MKSRRLGLSLVLLAAACSSAEGERASREAKTKQQSPANVGEATEPEPTTDAPDSVELDAKAEPEPEPEPDAEAKAEPLPPLEGPLPLSEIAGVGPETTRETIVARFAKYDEDPDDEEAFGYRPEHGGKHKTPGVVVGYDYDKVVRFDVNYKPKHPPSEFGLSGPWIDLLGKDANTAAAALGEPVRVLVRGAEVPLDDTPITNDGLPAYSHVMWVWDDVKKRDGASTQMSAELYFDLFDETVVVSSLEVRWFPPRAAEPPKPTLAKVKVPVPKGKPGLSRADFRGVALAKAKSEAKSIDRSSGGVGVSVSYPEFTFSDAGRTRFVKDRFEKRLLEEARTLDGKGESGMFEYSCDARLAAEFLVSFTCSGVDGRMLDEDLDNGTGGGGALEVWSETLIVSPVDTSTLEVFDVASAFSDKSLADLMWLAAAIAVEYEELEASEVERAIDEVGRSPFDEGTALAFFNEDGLAVHLCPDGDLDDCVELSIPWEYAHAIAAKDSPIAALRAVFE